MQTKPSRKKKFIIVSAIAAILIIVAVVVGVEVSKKKRRNTANGESDGGNGTQNPPTFGQDSKLHNSFWGIAYTPYGALAGTCGASQPNVTLDMQQLSQLTTRIRLYAADCNVTALLLQSIKDLKVDVSIYPAIYVNPDEESYNSQKAAILLALDTYGPERILGVTVGNEYVLNAPSRGDTIPAATARVVAKMSDMRSSLAAKGYSNILVGTSDAAGVFLEDLAKGADYLFANVHPWFSQNLVDNAAWFASTYFESVVAPLANKTGRPIQLFQGEFGWPTATDTPALGINPGGSPAGVPELQKALDQWVCASNRNETKYFWFAAYDEPWKAMYGGVEAHWGLFDPARNLKNITIPDCPHS